jgi:hypothetical protein
MSKSDEGRIVVVRRFRSQAEAEVAQSALRAYRIPAAIQVGSHHGLAATMDVWVREGDVSAAIDILGPDDGNNG